MAEQPIPQYLLRPAAEGTSHAIHRQDGAQVPIDPNNQDFCDFLTWASHQQQRPAQDYDRLLKGDYFASTEKLIEFCKHRGITLQVDAVDHTGQLQTDLPPGLVWNANFRFYELRRSIALPSGTGQTAPNGIVGTKIPVYVSKDLLDQLNVDLQREDSDIRCVSSWTVNRAFLYVDISDFSKLAAGQQVLVINTLIAITEDASLWRGAGNNDAAVAREQRDASICIGDGYIFVFRSAIAATAFSAYLAQLIETLVAKHMIPVEFRFRMGVHFGPVFRFWDFGRKDWNYIGDGINGGQRVLSAVGKDTDDVVFVSSQVRQQIIAENRETRFHRAMRAEMLNRGRRADKHGNPWRVYEVNHTALAGMLLPISLRADNAL